LKSLSKLFTVNLLFERKEGTRENL